jgi:NADH-quinone oxidoreductase subunit L
VLVSFTFIASPPPGDAYRQVLWTWFEVGSLRPQIAFYLDAMTVIFILVITFVGFLIHLYSTEFMEEDDAYTRFFMYMNLFVASMLTLVLADNLLLYMGWGVGMCSYAIAFWQRRRVRRGRAFIVTRVGAGAHRRPLLAVHELGCSNSAADGGGRSSGRPARLPWPPATAARRA